MHWRLSQQGWYVSLTRVKQIWRREGLTVPQMQPKRGRLWLKDGSCIRLRPMSRNDVWSNDFVTDGTHDGGAFRMLTIVDEYTLVSLAVHVKRKLNSQDVLHVLGKLFVHYGPPQYIPSDNGRSSRLRPCVTGSAESARRRSSLSRGSPGKTVSVRVLTASSGTNA